MRETAPIWLATSVACAWVCLSGSNAPAVPVAGAAFLVAAAIAAWIGSASSGNGPRRMALALWAIAGLAGALLFSGPWRWGWAALVVSSGLMLPQGEFLGRARRALWLLARHVSITGAMLLVLEPLWARWHVVPGVAHVTWPIVRLSGAAAAVEGSALRVSGSPHATTYVPSPEHLAIDAAALLALSLFWVGVRRALLARLMVACVVWLPIRYAILVLLTSYTSDHAAFWHPAAVAVSILPLAALALWLAPDRAQSVGGAPPAEAPTPGLAPTLIGLLGGLCLGVGLFFVDPGAEKPGRLLIDESHGPWESTLVPMDTRTLTPLSSYNYYWLAEWLGEYYDVARHRRGPLTDTVLDECDVLMLKVPTEPPTESEIESVIDFVHRGGGLWLVGDHTNVFGTSTCLNPLAERFGIHYVADATYGIGVGGLPAWKPPPYSLHPIVRHIPGAFLVHTACTLRAPMCRGALLPRALKIVKADTSRRHFFPGKRAKATEFGFGIYPICVTRSYGAGRVVAFSDSTVWSNYLCFVPGKPELALGTVEWLRRTNRLGFVPLLALCASLGLLAGGYAAYRARVRARPEGPLAACWAGCLVAALACVWLTARAYPLPRPAGDIPVVCFAGEGSDIFLPIESYTDPQRGSDRDYRTLYAWVLRSGALPAYTWRLDDAMERGDAVVVVNPARPPTPGHMRRLAEYVRAGGRLLLMIGTNGPVSAPEQIASANELLRPFGLRVEAPTEQAEGVVRFGSGQACRALALAAVLGGTSFATLPDGSAVGAYRDVEGGRVVVFTAAGAMTGRGLGGPLDRYSAVQIGRSRLAFEVFRSLGLPSRAAEGREGTHEPDRE